MKWLIASDIHGSVYYCRLLLEAFAREKADRILLLGDILYHGPRNDLPRDYAPKEVCTMLESVKDSILCVRGNCDTEVDQMVLSFPILAEYAILSEGSRMIFAVHGHNFNTEKLPPLHNGDILLHGHTHIPVIDRHDSFTYLNPGSVSIPKNDSPHSYMTLEKGHFEWKDISGEKYMEFDPE